jgi:hypothetical protein
MHPSGSTFLLITSVKLGPTQSHIWCESTRESDHTPLSREAERDTSRIRSLV